MYWQKLTETICPSISTLKVKIRYPIISDLEKRRPFSTNFILKYDTHDASKYTLLSH